MSRWLFAEDGSAIQMQHVVRLAVGRTGENEYPFCVQAHIVGNGQQPHRLARYKTVTETKEAIKDMVVGREHKRY